MNLLSYIRELAPVMERRDLLKNLEQLQMEYDDTIAPILNDMEEVFQTFQPKSVIYRKLEVAYRRNYNVKSNIMGMVFSSVKNARSNFDAMRDEVRSLFSIQFTNANLTFNRASLLKYIEGVAFAFRFVRRFSLLLIAQEAALLGKATKQRWSSAELEWVETGIDEFVALHEALSLSTKEFKARISQTSEATISEATYRVAEQSLGNAKMDGLNTMGFSPRHNPFLILGRIIAEYQAERYLASQQELYGLQLRLEELRSLIAGDPSNPVIQKQIEAYENRISEYEYKIAKLEERARSN